MNSEGLKSGGMEEVRFRDHNFRVWPRREVHLSGQVLVELTPMAPRYILFSYLSNVLADMENGVEIVGMRAHSRHWLGSVKASVSNLLGRFWWLIEGRIGKLYRSFGTNRVAAPSVVARTRGFLQALKFVHSWHLAGRSKRDLERLEVDGILVGDLIYDSFLRSRNEPTVHMSTLDFKFFLVNELAHFYFWRGYFDKHSVVGVIATHSVYSMAFPLRIAASKGIHAFEADPTKIYRLTLARLWTGDEFKEFPKVFRSLPVEIRREGVLEAQNRLERRFRGEVGVDMTYLSVSAFSPSLHPPVLSKSEKLKVLVATHCFFDSPHTHGFHAFPDFWEWLDFIGRFSARAEHEFYLKPHPSSRPGNMEVLREFGDRYPNFRILPNEVSHHQLVEEGISVVLTVYGTIGMEYAALGVPVINASFNNPHVAYDFNYHAKDPGHLLELMENIEELSGPDSRARGQVFEYYFMQHIRRKSNILSNGWPHTETYLARPGSTHDIGPTVLDVFLGEWDQGKHNGLIERLARFVDSDAPVSR